MSLRALRYLLSALEVQRYRTMPFSMSCSIFMKCI